MMRMNKDVAGDFMDEMSNLIQVFYGLEDENKIKIIDDELLGLLNFLLETDNLNMIITTQGLTSIYNKILLLQQSLASKAENLEH